MQLLLAATWVLLWYPAPAMGADLDEEAKIDYPGAFSRTDLWKYSLNELRNLKEEKVREIAEQRQRLKGLEQDSKAIDMAIRQIKDILPFDIKRMILSYTFYPDQIHKLKAVYPELTDRAIANDFTARPRVWVHGAGYKACDGFYHYRNPDEKLPDGFNLNQPGRPWYQKDENIIIKYSDANKEWLICDKTKYVITPHWPNYSRYCYYAPSSSATPPEAGWKNTWNGTTFGALPVPKVLLIHTPPPLCECEALKKLDIHIACSKCKKR